MKLKLSDFLANDDMELHYKDNQPCSNIDGAETYFVKNGDAIPEIFVSQYIRNNPKFIKNLEIKNGIPILSVEQQKKYNISFPKLNIESFKENIDKEYNKYTEEKLAQKVNKLGKEKFKVWAEKEFGEDNIDRRKSTSKIIINILRMQGDAE